MGSDRLEELLAEVDIPERERRRIRRLYYESEPEDRESILDSLVEQQFYDDMEE